MKIDGFSLCVLFGLVPSVLASPWDRVTRTTNNNRVAARGYPSGTTTCYYACPESFTTSDDRTATYSYNSEAECMYVSRFPFYPSILMTVPSFLMVC